MGNYHILNGDALKEQFPSDNISGELIIARECLVTGPVKSQTLEELIKIRATYLNDDKSNDTYQNKVVLEIQKILNISSGEVNLWFEEDLFCQVNLWFVCSQLYLKKINVNLVLPTSHIQYGFGGMNQEELVLAYNNKIQLTAINVNQFALLWFAYRNDDIERLLKLGVQMYSDFPFVMKAIEAHFERLPSKGNPGRPAQIIIDIIREKSTTDFAIIFREFRKRAPIYGFGDLQVKAIYDEITTYS